MVCTLGKSLVGCFAVNRAKISLTQTILFPLQITGHMSLWVYRQIQAAAEDAGLSRECCWAGHCQSLCLCVLWTWPAFLCGTELAAPGTLSSYSPCKADFLHPTSWLLLYCSVRSWCSELLRQLEEKERKRKTRKTRLYFPRIAWDVIPAACSGLYN